MKFLYKEKVFSVSLIIFIFLTLYLQRVPKFTIDEFKVLFILLILSIIVKGLENSNILSWLALNLEKGKYPYLKLLFGTFLLSSFLTIDVALIIIIPITFLMNIKNKDLVIILENIVAHLGFMPYSTPQNLYIYLHYDLFFSEYFNTMFLFIFGYLAVALIAGLIIKNQYSELESPIDVKFSKKGFPYLFFLILMFLSILKIIPLFLGIIILLYSLFLDQKSLKIDYILLFTFLLFFGISDNLSVLLNKEFKDTHEVFFTSLFLSQVISNVPASIIMSDMSIHWDKILWGVNVGGFGNLWGSMANLITFRLYLNKFEKDNVFIKKFFIINILALLYGILLYFIYSKTNLL